MQLRLLSVNVGRPKIIAHINGEDVRSGIAKHPVNSERVFVGATNIEGDEQADLSVHGGVDKAVYAYPSTHWPWWEGEHQLACAPGTFGENLTLEGADETEIAIGDRFAWGDAVLEVSQPRSPCFKLGIHTARHDVPMLLTQSGRCGWYLRVIQRGEAATNSILMRVAEGSGPSVRDVFFARHHPKQPLDLLRRASQAPALTESWRQALAEKAAKAL